MGRTDCPYVDEIRTSRFLGDQLPVAHGVLLTLPLTDDTRGMIDEAAIGRMHSGAVLVDIGRGGVVDESALIAALRDGRLAGAALDGFATEPLAPDSPLWELPNVLLSPHTAGLSRRENERIVDLFCENLRRYLAFDELLAGSIRTCATDPDAMTLLKSRRGNIVTSKHKVKVGRPYDKRMRGDGLRVLVDRIWPRGLSKENADLDEWCKDVAPSTVLRKWYGHDPDRFEEFGQRYRDELDKPERAEALAHLRELSQRRNLTLLTASKRADISEATVLVELLRR